MGAVAEIRVVKINLSPFLYVPFSLARRGVLPDAGRQEKLSEKVTASGLAKRRGKLEQSMKWRPGEGSNLQPSP